MSPANRPGSRPRRTVSGGGNAYRRGSGLGSGSVGGGPRGSSGGSFGGDSGGDRGVGGGGGLLAVLLALLIGGAGNNNSNGGNKRGCLGRILVLVLIVVGVVFLLNMCSGNTSGSFLSSLLGDYTSTTTDSGLSSVDNTTDNSGSSSGSVSDTLGSLPGSYGSTTGQIAPVSGSSDVYKAHEPNREVASAARDKYTDTASAKSVTVMVYMCGTDLESKSGMATSDLEEMVNATLGSNINIILETGGTSNWQNQVVKSNTNQRFRVKQGGLETLDANVGKRSMVDPNTLADFIQFSAREFPADRYMLILWDHGGGSLTGYGYDELFPNGSMSLDGINTALKKGGVRFDIIGFDACLMATLETALVAQQYGDYLIASEAVEPGTGWYYTNWLSALSNNPAMDSLDVGKNIIDDYVKMSGNSQTTLSMTDLAELNGTVPAAFKAFSSSTSQLIAGDGFNTVATARSGSRDFSTSSKINQIDLIHFAENLGTDEAKTLAGTLGSAVKYNRNSSNISHANGLSIYFPYQSLRSVSTAIETYNAIGLDKSYSDCIKSFASVAAGGQVASGSSENPLGTLLGDNTGSLLGSLLGGTASSSDTASGSADTITQLLDLFLSNRSVVTGDKDSSWVDENLVRGSIAEYQKNNAGFANLMLTYKGDVPTLVLTEEQWSSVVTLEQNVYLDDGEGYIDLGLDNVADYDADNDLIIAYDGTWMSLNGQIVAYYLVSEDQIDDSFTILGRVPAMLNGTRVNIILEFTSDAPNGAVLGAQYDYAANTTETVMKGLVEIKAGDKIDFLCDFYNYDGTFNDAYYLGEQMTASGSWEIGNAPLGDGVNWDMAYRITDIYGGQYWTPTVKNY
ncbi:MAG TPA: clostripain-related cysteine peptidase [Clostridia bacterium]|nr:clostripain-related cysteine peptidase [Clostridia bacterium]